MEFPAFHLSVVIGLALSDAYLRFATPQSKTTLLEFKQSIVNSEYF